MSRYDLLKYLQTNLEDRWKYKRLPRIIPVSSNTKVHLLRVGILLNLADLQDGIRGSLCKLLVADTNMAKALKLVQLKFMSGTQLSMTR